LCSVSVDSLHSPSLTFDNFDKSAFLRRTPISIKVKAAP
jgi:hypothetical protein